MIDTKHPPSETLTHMQLIQSLRLTGKLSDALFALIAHSRSQGQQEMEEYIASQEQHITQLYAEFIGLSKQVGESSSEAQRHLLEMLGVPLVSK